STRYEIVSAATTPTTNMGKRPDMWSSCNESTDKAKAESREPKAESLKPKASALWRSVEKRVVGARADDVAVYGLHDVGARRIGGKRQHLVERIQFELIVQRSDTGWRARRAIADNAASTGDLTAAVGQLGANGYALGYLCRGRRYVPPNPEHLFDDPLRRVIVGTVHHQRE